MSAFAAGNSLPAGYGWRLDARVIEIPYVLAQLPAGPQRLLDAGSSLNHRMALSSAPLADKQLTILSLVVESEFFASWGISYVYGDMRNTIFREASFDTIVCISTLEHVGMDNSMYGAAPPDQESTMEFLIAVKEMRRILRPGGLFFVTVPFGRYENHGWFQQFDADRLDMVASAFSAARVQERIYRYARSGWEISDRATTRDCSFFDVHKARGEDGSIVYGDDFAAAERAVACMMLQ